ncbi:MAG: LysR family transcriptional regulator [Gammaproteobacteria bacterium]|nr:LysR family transcriptional regulator [Gammaproteobacteria bacterium]
MKFELKHLLTLQALRDTERLTDAAERVFVTPSAISHQMRELEERLNCVLVYRRQQPYAFTSAGQRLLDLADEIVPKIQDANADIARLAEGDAGRLYIAIECHSCYDWLLPTLDQYQRSWPDVDVDISGGFGFQPQDAVCRGELDLVITADPIDDQRLAYIPLFKYEARLAVSSTHRLARRSHVVPEDLESETLITYPVERSRLDVFTSFLDEAGVQPQQVRTAEITSLMIQRVASGRVVTCLPDWVLRDYEKNGYIVSKRLGRKGVFPTLFAAIRRDYKTLPFIQDFCATARRSFESDFTISRSTREKVA